MKWSFLRQTLRRLMMLFPGYRKCSFLEQTVERRFGELQGSFLALSEEVKGVARRVDALQGCHQTLSEAVQGMGRRVAVFQGQVNSYLDYVNPELSVMSRRGGGRRVLLIGYYGGNNLGDELMLRVVLKAFSEFPLARITVMLCENPDYDSSSLGDVDIIHYCRTRMDLSHIASEFDALMIGGGALLDDLAYSWCANHFKSLSFIVAELPRYFKAKNKPVVGYGLSTNGTLATGVYSRLLSEVVGRADYFSVRDSFSLSTLAQCGVPTEKVRVVDDIVLCDQALCDKCPIDVSNDCITIGIVWVSSDELQQLLVDTIQGVIALGGKFKKEIRVQLIPFYDFNHADILYYEASIRALPSSLLPFVRIVDYDNDLLETVRKLTVCDVVIAMRYHAAVICASKGIPLVAIKLANHPHYQNKMAWVANEFSEHTTLLDTLASAEEIVNTCGQQYEHGRGTPLSLERVLRNAWELKTAVHLAATGPRAENRKNDYV